MSDPIDTRSTGTPPVAPVDGVVAPPGGAPSTRVTAAQAQRAAAAVEADAIAKAARPLSKWKLMAVLAGFIFVSDQITKYMAVDHLTLTFEAVNAQTFGEKVKAFAAEKDVLERGLAEQTPAVVVPQFWQHRYTQNRGAAWGFLAGANEKFRVPFFYLISIAAVIFIFSYYRKLQTHQRYLQTALALVLGGAMGNALDRVLRGYVIDFIDWHWMDPNWMNPGRHWPTFNVADAGISVGLVLLFLEMVLTKQIAARERAAYGLPPAEETKG